MIKIAVGHSEDVETIDAIEDVLEQCRKELGGLLPQAGIVYSAIDFEYEVILGKINERYPNIELIGCTTDGEISSNLGCVEDSITLILFCSDTIEIKAGLGRDISKDIDAAAKNAVEEAKSKLTKDAKFCITLAESISIGGVAVIEGIKQQLGDSFPVFGGLAADQWNMVKTYQFYKEEVLTDSVQVLIFGGNISFSSGIASGWEPIGNQKTVTKAEGNVIYELDGEPILDFYNHYVGGNFSRVPTEYPLAVFPNKSSKFYIRSPHCFNEKDKSVTFFGDVPVGITVQLVSGTMENLSRASEKAIKEAVASYKGKNPQAALIFTCSARKAILGLNVYKEYALLKESMPKEFSVCGFYTYGEIAPLCDGDECRFHNGTIVVLLLGEENE